MRNTPSRRSIVATLVLVFLFITTGFAIPTFTETLLPFLQGDLNANAAWLGGVSAPSADASVTTDRSDYRPGQIVHITGGGFGPGEEVRLEVDYVPTGLKVQRPDFSNVASGHDPWYVTADGGGNFTADWLVEEDSLNQTLRLTADGQSSGLHAETTFTDASIGTYDQCSNDDGDGYPGPPPGNADEGCHWINGNLNANNSTYHEGDSTVQRLWVDDITPGSTHTVTFQYGTTKAGKHAYDYLTTWNHSENWIGLADRCQDIPGCTTAGETTFAIPNDPNVPDTIELPPGGPLSRLFTARGATITAISVPTIASGTYAGDSETDITVTVTLDSTGPMCDAGGCGVAIWFGAHIARTEQWTAFNGTTGATTIPGSPYHVSLSKLDGNSIGNRDNQMQANAIVPPTGVLTITKSTLGGFDTFGYTVSPTPSPLPGTGAFNLTTSAPVNPASTSFAAVPAGFYTVTENAPPAGWVLFSLTCSGDTDGGNVITLASRRVVIDLDNTEGQNCTFVNIKPDARIVLSPVTANNEVNTPHTIVATVTQNDQLDAGAPGDGTTGFGPAPDNTLVTFSLLNNTAGATFVAGNTCLTSGGTGTCSVQINSSNVGGVDVRATTTFGVLGVNLTRTTNDGVSGDGVDSHKNYVSGTIAITPSGVNEVNHQHTFTIVVTQAPGAATPATTANVTITPSPAPGSVTNNCINPVAFVGNVATCTYIINNPSAGLFTVNASASFNIGGVTVNRMTNGLAGNSGPATKRFVDAQIDLTPLTATNPVNQAHTISALVQQDDGLPSGAPGDGATGFGPAPNGVTVTFTLLNNTAGATFVAGNTCLTAGGTGTCTIQINSTTPGGVDIHATTTFSVGGVSLTRATGTGGLNSADAHKDYVAGSITIIKDAVPDSARDFAFTTTGGLVPAAFSLDDDADPTLLNTRVYSNLAPGPYTVSETLPVSGWDLTNLVCTGGGANTTTTLATGLSTIGLDAGENVVCTYTNTKQTTLKLVKTVTNDNGGTAVPNAWDLVATGAGGFTELTPDIANATARIVNPAVNYGLSEINGPSGYTQGTFSCVTNGGAPVIGNSITLAVGDAGVCTVNNDDNEPHLRLNKIVVNDNGGTALESAWTLFAAGPTGFSGAGAPGSPDVNSPASFDAGSYALSESAGPAGYSASLFTCVLTGTATPVTVTAGSVTVGLGQDITCSITNDDNEPHLRLNKIVVNDNGGTALESAWTLFAAGPTGFSGAGAAGSPDVNSPASFDAGSYALSESAGPANYTASAFTCVLTGTATPVTVTAGSVTVGLGQDITCSITNNDNEPHLRLNKIVVNDNGGTALESAWTLFAAGPTGFSGAGAPGSPDVNSPAGFDAGSYALSESAGPANYTASAFTCVLTGTATPVTVTAGSVTVGLGQDITCSITNDDNEPHLRLNKIVVNDNGGTALESAWTLFAAGPTGFSGAGAPGSPDVNSPAGFDAGSYALSESAGPANYTASAFTCVLTGTATPVTVTAGSVTVGLGQDVTCSITNDDNEPHLRLNKIVVNDNGGTALESAWTLFAAGPTGFSGAGAAGSPDVNSPAGFDAGSYALSESAGPAGYSASLFTCVLTGTATSVTVTAGSVTVGLGQDITCSITNNDIAPQLRVIKVLIPSDDPGLFNLRIDGATAGTGANVGNNGTTGFVPVNAGGHVVSETQGTGTLLSNYASEISGDCDASGNVSVVVGGPSKTCTITNRRLPTLKIIKMITGESSSFDFVIDRTAVDPVNPVDLTLTPPADGSASDGPDVITVGDHNVMEVNIPGNWLLMGAECVSDQPTGFVTSGGPPNVLFTARYGDDVTCTFVNNQQGGTTRTQGFWATHTVLTNTIWNGGTLPPGTMGQNVTWTPVIGSPDQYLCKPPTLDPPFDGVAITAIPQPGMNQVMGGFWSSIATTTTRQKRSALDKARMQFLQQYLAAVLNVHIFGTPIPGTTLANARATYCGTDSRAIITQAGLLGAYNESGDSGVFTPGANATAQLSKLQADEAFWNTTFR